VLPFRNAGATLAAAIRSIERQTEARWVLKLIDDGSSDDSLALARRFVSDRVLLSSDGRHLGLSRRLNAAIGEVATPYVCRMDADDIAFPQRLQRQLALLESDPAIDLVASPVLVFRSDGTVIGMMRAPAAHDDICATPWRGFVFPHPTWTGRTAWFKRHPYNPDDDGAEDQALLYRAYTDSRFAATEEVLLAYREDTRTFRKQFHRRRRFWNAVFRDGARRQAWGDVALLSLAQPARIAGDALSTLLKVGTARNRLQPVTGAVRAEWQAVERATR
jgi:glycosyltransferase involved in cell wall biosynthesis